MRTALCVQGTGVCVIETGANGTCGFNGLIEISAYGSGDAMSVSIFDRLPMSTILERPRLYVSSVDIEAIQLIERIAPFAVCAHLSAFPLLHFAFGASACGSVLVGFGIELKLRALPFLGDPFEHPRLSQRLDRITDGLLAEPDPLRQRLHTDFIADTRPPIRMQFEHQPDECCLPVNIPGKEAFKGTARTARHGEGERSVVFIHRDEQWITPVMRELERPSNIPFRRGLPLNPVRRFPKRVSDIPLRDMQQLRELRTTRPPRLTPRPLAMVAKRQRHHRLKRTHAVGFQLREDTKISKRELERRFLVFIRGFENRSVVMDGY